MSSPDVSIIIPVRNEGAHIQKAIASALSGRSGDLALEIVVVDDASTDGCCEAIEELADWRRRTSIRCVRLPEWSGIPFARNRGAAMAQGTYLLFTDGNVCFPDHWDVPIRMAAGPDRAVCLPISDETGDFAGYGCRLVFPSLGVAWIPSPLAYGGLVPIAPSAGTVIARALFAALGGYDESLPMYGAAEAEFSIRIWLAGRTIVLAGGQPLVHRFRPLSERNARMAPLQHILLRNYLRLACMYLRASLLIRTFDHYARLTPDGFSQALSDVLAGDAWLRHERLSATLRYDFDWFARQFTLRDQEGKVIA